MGLLRGGELGMASNSAIHSPLFWLALVLFTILFSAAGAVIVAGIKNSLRQLGPVRRY